MFSANHRAEMNGWRGAEQTGQPLNIIDGKSTYLCRPSRAPLRGLVH